MSTIETSLENLRGTAGNYLMTVLGFAFALASSLHGVYSADLGVDAYVKPFFYLSVLFMISSVLAASKTVRDGQFADEFPNAFASVVRGSVSWRVQALGMALVSVVFPFHTALSIGKGDWTGELGFLLLGLSYLLSSTLNLSKVSRDRTDAHYFEQNFSKLGVAPEQVARTLDTISAGTVMYILLNALSLVMSLGATLTGVWGYPTLVVERKGLITTGLFFMTYAAMQVSKLVRDMVSKDPTVSKNVTFAYSAMTWLGGILSLVVLFGALSIMPLEPAQRRFAVTGCLYTLSSTLAVSKLVRDQSERKKKIA